ncbi:MAG: hypothetical protein K940chlam5_00460 [Candidatus Anoxychlamydiales bacterium]|nr:hypothetical protein [Candidatus Anoxychlamydiales bacterium]
MPIQSDPYIPLTTELRSAFEEALRPEILQDSLGMSPRSESHSSTPLTGLDAIVALSALNIGQSPHISENPNFSSLLQHAIQHGNASIVNTIILQLPGLRLLYPRLLYQSCRDRFLLYFIRN